nr:hypothetical protein [Pseudomonas caspiana]
MPNYEWTEGKEFALLLVPDLLWAIRFKDTIKNNCVGHKKLNLARYVKKNNHANLTISIGLALLTLTAFYINPTSILTNLIIAFALVRFISRSAEIFYAFYRDAIQSGETSTALNKYERIKLALKSYLEIYAYSAPAYLALPCYDTMKALTLSLNVGTLTNVGMAFSTPTYTANLLVFVQVFTTLCLVVLSLASYISRTGDEA